MPPAVLIGLAAAVGGALLLFGGSSSSPGRRAYTRADIPKLRELMLAKVYLGRELRNCLMKQTEHSLFNTQQAVSFGVGLFVGVATLNPGQAMTAARATDAALTKVGGGKAPACQKEMELTQQQLKHHDQVCGELGLPIDVTYEAVQAIVAQLGGLNPLTAAEEADPRELNSNWSNWDRCVSTSSVASCKAAWAAEGNPLPPKIDPKTGMAVR
jgi:hypothetical protein